MAENFQSTEMTNHPSTNSQAPADHTKTPPARGGMMACGMGRQGVKGILMMAACCGVPLLLLLMLPVVGSTWGGIGTSVVNVLAVAACPIGMGLMMWLMMRAQRTASGQMVQEKPATLEPESHVGVTPQDV